MDPVRRETIGLLHIAAGSVSRPAKYIQRRNLRRRENELKSRTILPQLPEQAAEIQRVFSGLLRGPGNAGIATPGPLVIGLMAQSRVVPVPDVAPLPRPGQMIRDQDPLAGNVTRAEIQQREA